MVSQISGIAVIVRVSSDVVWNAQEDHISVSFLRKKRRRKISSYSSSNCGDYEFYQFSET